MKKSVLIAAVLWTVCLFPVIAEQVNVVSSTNTCGNSSSTLCTSKFADGKKIQIIYPSSLFTKQVNGVTVDFNYIRGIVLYTNTNTSTDLPNSYGIQLKMWLTSQASFSGSSSFLTEPSEGVLSFTSAKTIDNTNKCLSFEVDKSATSHLIYTVNSNVVVEITIPQSDTSLCWQGNTTYSNSSLHYSDSNTTTSTTVSSFIPKTDFICSRIYKNVTVDNSVYNLYTDKSEAELISFGAPSTPLTNIYSGYSSTFAGDDAITNLLFDKYYKITTVSYKGEDSSDGTYSFFDLNNSAFSNYDITENVAFEFPTTLSTISSSTAFQFKSIADGKSATIILTNQNYPTFPTDCSSMTSDAQKGNINLLFRQGVNSAFSISSAPYSTLESRFSKLGYVSYPFSITFPNDPNLKSVSRTRTGANADFFNQLLVIQAPYKDKKFSISLDGSVEDINNDGTVHFYSALESQTFSRTAPVSDYSFENGVLTGKLTGEYSFQLESRYYAQLRSSENATAYIDWKEISGINNYTFLSLCDSLVFANNTDNVSPEWKFTNSTSNSVNSITTSTPIYVKKEINNKKYLFFSLPFSCNVSDIKVTYKDINSLVSHNQNCKLPLLTTAYNQNTYASDDDKFMIFKYVGQDPTQDENAKYEQITSDTEVLQANRGYAFAVIESDDNYFGSKTERDYSKDNRVDVVAVISFKDSRGSSSKNLYVNTYSGFDFASESTTATETTSNVLLTYSPSVSWQHNWNKGWSLVGNPFYHSIPASSYGKYATTIGCANCTDEEATKNVYHHRTSVDKSLTIAPFEAFYVRADLNTDGTAQSISINPSASQNAPAYGLGFDREEVISVAIKSDNVQEDYTAIIGSENKDKHFSNADDLPKMFNSGFAELCSYFDGVPCAFKELDLHKDSITIIPLAVKSPFDSTYLFAIDTARHYFNGSVMLHDKSLNRYDNLSANGIPVSLTAGYDTSRFELVVIPSELPTDIDNVETYNTFESYFSNGTLVIDNIAEGSMLSIFDATGKLLYSAAASGSFNYQFSVRGVYMVVLSGNTNGSVKVVY